MEKIECSKCGTKFESDSYSSLCGNCRRKRNTNVYKVIAIIILFLGFIGGIVLGDTNRTIELVYELSISSKYNEYEEVFNIGLMVSAWISTALLSLFIFAIYSICHRLDLIVEK